jgi:hypothetical protein
MGTLLTTSTAKGYVWAFIVPRPSHNWHYTQHYLVPSFKEQFHTSCKLKLTVPTVDVLLFETYYSKFEIYNHSVQRTYRGWGRG